TGAGWNLSLNISSFKSADVALKGVNITIPVSLEAGTDNTSAAPSIVKSISGIVDPVSGFDAGTVVSANVGEGYGTWISKFSGASLN
ncbi:WxL domain-containing protein, partial [Enterococcus faecalis]